MYAVTGEVIAVQAVDSYGIRSNIVLVAPPPPPNNITPDGQGEVIDHLFSEDGDGAGIELFTISTRTGNIFYLIIDHSRTGNNVYFLNTVSEWDLITMAYDAEVPRPPATVPTFPEQTPMTTGQEVAITPEIETTTVTPQQPEIDEPQTSGSGVNNHIILVVGLIIIGVGVVGFKKFFKPKKDYFNDDDDMDDEDESDTLEGDGFIEDDNNESSNSNE